MFKHQSLQAFLDQLASPSATPGGGSAAAIMGAMGAALVSMVANLTLGKPKYQAVEAEMQEILARAELLRAKLTQAMEEDIAAYNQVMATYRLPQKTEEDKARRQLARQSALKTATLVPLNCARLCAEVLELCRQAAEQGNANAVIDAGIGALAAQAALRACALNVAVNLKALGDASFAQACRSELEQILSSSLPKAEEFLTTISLQLSP